MIIAIANDKMSRESLLVNLLRIFFSPLLEVPTDPPMSTLCAPLKYGSSPSTPGMLPGRGGSALCHMGYFVYARWPYFRDFRESGPRWWHMPSARSGPQAGSRRGRGE